MIFYPLAVLMLSGIREIAIITTPKDQEQFIAMLGDGSQWGVSFTYIKQPSPDGLAQAYTLTENFLAGAPSAMILGDNIFHGHRFQEALALVQEKEVGGTVFCYRVLDPERYGVVEFNRDGKAISIIEKPEKPTSDYAVTGLYFYDEQVCDIASEIQPSARGELEITDLNLFYLQKGQLQVEIMNRGFAWLDTGTHDSLLEASSFIATLQKRQGLMVACPEEIAFRWEWIDAEQVIRLAEPLANSDYGKYLLELAQ